MVSSQSHNVNATLTYFRERAKAVTKKGRAKNPFKYGVQDYDWTDFSNKNKEMWKHIQKLHKDHLERLQKAEVKNIISFFPFFHDLFISLPY